MFVIEAAIARFADVLGVDAAVIQARNLNQTGDTFPYGQQIESEARACRDKAVALYGVVESRRRSFCRILEGWLGR